MQIPTEKLEDKILNATTTTGTGTTHSKSEVEGGVWRGAFVIGHVQVLGLYFFLSRVLSVWIGK